MTRVCLETFLKESLHKKRPLPGVDPIKVVSWEDRYDNPRPFLYSTREESLQILNMAPKVILISLLCFLYENLEVMSPIDFTGKATTLMQKLLDVTKDVFCEVAFQTPSELSVIYFFPTHLRFSKKLVQLFYFFSYFWL